MSVQLNLWGRAPGAPAAWSRRRRRAGGRGLLLALLIPGWWTVTAVVVAGQAAPVGAGGDSTATVQPVFDGWFVNPDGTFSLSFGYYSRSVDLAIDIPLGPDNVLEPAELDGRQPTHFRPQPRD